MCCGSVVFLHLTVCKGETLVGRDKLKENMKIFFVVSGSAS